MRHRPPSPAAPAAPSPCICAARLALRREADGQTIGETRRPPNGRWRGARIACGEAQEARAARGEYAGVGDGCALAECIGPHGSPGAKVHEHIGNNLDETRAAFEECAGAFNGPAGFNEDPIRDAGPAIPNTLGRCIDRGPLARDRKSNGEMLVFETGGGAFRVFRAR